MFNLKKCTNLIKKKIAAHFKFDGSKLAKLGQGHQFWVFFAVFSIS